MANNSSLSDTNSTPDRSSTLSNKSTTSKATNNKNTSQATKSDHDHPDYANLLARIMSLENKVKTLDQNLQNEITKEAEQANKIAHLEKKVEDLLIHKKKNNIILHGVTKTDTGPNQCFRQIVQENLKADNKRIHVIESRFLGKGPHSPLLVTLGSMQEKEYLQSNYKNLKGSKISVTDDLTPKQLTNRKILLAKRRELLDNKSAKTVYIYESAIKADGVWYDLQLDGSMSKRRLHAPSPMRA